MSESIDANIEQYFTKINDILQRCNRYQPQPFEPARSAFEVSSSQYGNIDQRIKMLENPERIQKTVNGIIQNQLGGLINNQKQGLRRQIEQLSSQLSERDRALASKDAIIQSNLQRISQLQTQNSKIRIENTTLRSNLQILKVKLIDSQSSSNQRKYKIQKCALSIKGISIKLQAIKMEYNEIKRELLNFKQLLQIQQNSKSLKRILAKLEYQVNQRLENMKSGMEKQLQSKIEQQANFQYELLQYVGVTPDRHLSIQESNIFFQNEISRHLKLGNVFCDSLILQDPEKKQCLVDNLKKFVQGNVLKTRLLYRSDPLNRTNFHKYIDGKFNIVLLTRLSNGYVIGGYSYTPIEKDKTEKSKKGFIFSLTKSEFYLPREQINQTIVSFDDYYVIFGNSEIRIKVQEYKLYSNFGISSSTFEPNGKKVNDFLGQQSNETTLDMFEVYQVASI